MNKKRYFDTCVCHTCEKHYHYLGIARHRAMHRDKKENCMITFTNGKTWVYKYDLMSENYGEENNCNEK